MFYSAFQRALCAFAVSTVFTAVGGTAHISGTTFTTTDGSAMGLGLYPAARFLRYTGNPAPAGFSHIYQWANPSIAVYPENAPVTLSGTINVSSIMSSGGAVLIGLYDAGLLQAGGVGYQSGAYLYIAKVSGNLILGTSDGNVSAEVVQKFLTVTPAEIPASNVFNVIFTVNSGADPATCADNISSVPAGSTGCMYLEVSGFASGATTRTTEDSYGGIKRRNSNYGSGNPDAFYDGTYTYSEFASPAGALVGWDSSEGTLAYDLDVSPVATPYTFTGFFPPVDMDPLVNTAQAGRGVPFKWRILDGTTPVSDPASFVGFYSYPVACNTFAGDPAGAVEEYAKGASGLQYMGDGNWQFNWDTPRTYANTCRMAYVELSDGTKHYAQFQFKK